jgi:hypothetical protein
MLEASAEATPQPTLALSPEEKRRAMLAEFGLMSETDLATLLGVQVKTLRNRPFSELPDFTTAGRERLYYRASVALFLRKPGKSRRRKAVRHR